MANHDIPTVPRIWSCNWNWCPETFRDSRDLGKHLQETHFNNIRKVRKRDWEAYLRSTEGRSGDTDSLLAAIPDPVRSTQSLSQDRMEVDEPHRSPSGSIPPRQSTSESVRHRSPLSMTPPPVPPFPPNNHRNSAEIHAERQHPRATFNAYPSPGEAQQTNSPSSSSSSSQLSASDAKRRRMSFASYRAQSSPMSTPSIASVPPSPSLTNMVADAINRTGQLNEASPSVRPHSQSQSRKPASAAAAVPPLPRRTSLRQSPSAQKPRSYPSGLTQTSSFHPPSQPHASPTKASSANSPGAASVGSAEAVEEALTQNVLSSASSRAPHSSSQSSGASSSTSSPRKHAQAQPQPSPHSSGGSHAPGTQQLPDTPTKTEPLPDVKPVIKPELEPELAYPHSRSSSPTEAPAALAPEQPSSPPRLPRRRARSKTPAQQPPAPTRTLRSRSRSQATAPAPPPAAGQSKSLPVPLPRTRTRSRGASQTNADVSPPSTAAGATTAVKGQRAGSKPRSTGPGKRAGSVGPAAGGRKGTRANTNPGGLAAVDERPDEASQPAATQPQPQPQTQTQAQRPPTFRSGTLQLPRRQQIQASQALAQSQSPAQSQSQARAVAAGRFGQDEGMDVQVKRELLDAEPLSGQSQSQSQSQSQDGGAWTGFSLNPMELLTQKPFPSQSQGWGSSQ